MGGFVEHMAELRRIKKKIFIKKSERKISLGRKNADKRRIPQGVTGRLGRSRLH
jgi:hypothetical protein